LHAGGFLADQNNGLDGSDNRSQSNGFLGQAEPAHRLTQILMAEAIPPEHLGRKSLVALGMDLMMAAVSRGGAYTLEQVLATSGLPDGDWRSVPTRVLSVRRQIVQTGVAKGPRGLVRVWSKGGAA
jgi:hypothetical protein